MHRPGLGVRLLLLLVAWPALLPGCRAAAPPLASCGQPGSVVEDTLPEPARGYPYRFQVYLPPCYDRDSRQTYPVLFLLPGRGSGPGAWFAAGAAQAADELILDGRVPPFLIVATENTEADPQGTTILTELLPYVEDHYRLLTERPYRAVAGASLGGIGTYRLVLQQPEMFASAGIFGSGISYGEEEALRSWLLALPPDQEPRLFFNCGEQDPLMLARARVMISIVDEAGLENTSIFSPGRHTYGYWVANLPAFFRWLAQDWQ
jgi:S-formylglutathione hydrolase FrmB